MQTARERGRPARVASPRARCRPPPQPSPAGMKETTSWEGCASQTRPRAGAWGNPVSPSPCSRALPSQTRPRVGAWGNPVSPHPPPRDYLHVIPNRWQFRIVVAVIAHRDAMCGNLQSKICNRKWYYTPSRTTTGRHPGEVRVDSAPGCAIILVGASGLPGAC